jgi:hypothetical protein
MPSPPAPGLIKNLWRFWRESLARDGFISAARDFSRSLAEFLRESTPEQRRSRYGDAEYDWDYRVNTTSGSVNWRERLLGNFHSPYQPTEPALFQEMMAHLEVNFQDFTFVDIGSGKGRVLLMAADYPFRRILGIELFFALHQVAQENLATYKNHSQKCFALEVTCADARSFVFPAEPLVVYLFNPLPAPALIDMTANLVHSLSQSPRTVYVVYHNPLLEHVIARQPAFKKIAGTHQYSIFRAGE